MSSHDLLHCDFLKNALVLVSVTIANHDFDTTIKLPHTIDVAEDHCESPVNCRRILNISEKKKFIMSLYTQ